MQYCIKCGNPMKDGTRSTTCEGCNLRPIIADQAARIAELENWLMDAEIRETVLAGRLAAQQAVIDAAREYRQAELAYMRDANTGTARACARTGRTLDIVLTAQQAELDAAPAAYDAACEVQHG